VAFSLFHFCCREMSHCCNCLCICCGGMSCCCCYIIQTGLVGIIVNPEGSPEAVLVAYFDMRKCKKLEDGTTVNWDRKLLIIEAGPSLGT
jgi:hypothetical protein